MRSLKKWLRHRHIIWRYVSNRGHLKHDSKANALSRQLSADGFCQFDGPSVFDWPGLMDELNHEVNHSAHHDPASEKKFIVPRFGDHPTLDLTSIRFKLATHPVMVQTAQAYYDMKVRLRYINVWDCYPTDNSPRQSQLWHRDREDLRIFKFFMYLNEVGADQGPFCYAKGSHRRPFYATDPTGFLEADGTKRFTDESLAKSPFGHRIVQAKGPQGTSFIADTSGYHKGGYVLKGLRRLLVIMYTSHASQSHEFMTRPNELKGHIDSNLVPLIEDLPLA